MRDEFGPQVKSNTEVARKAFLAHEQVGLWRSDLRIPNEDEAITHRPAAAAPIADLRQTEEQSDRKLVDALR